MIYEYAVNVAVDKIADFMVDVLKIPQEELDFSYMNSEFSNLNAKNLLPKEYSDKKTIEVLQNRINFQQKLTLNKIQGIENLLKKNENNKEEKFFNVKEILGIEVVEKLESFSDETKELLNNVYNNILKTNPLIAYDFMEKCINRTSENFEKALKTNMELNPFVYSLYHNGEDGLLLFNYNEKNELENIGVINENSNEKICITETNYRNNEKDNLFEMDFSKNDTTIFSIIKNHIPILDFKIHSLGVKENFSFENNVNILNDKNQRIIFNTTNTKDNIANQTFEQNQTSLGFMEGGLEDRKYVSWIVDSNGFFDLINDASNEKFAQQNLKNVYTLAENLNFHFSKNEGVSNHIHNKKNDNLIIINKIKELKTIDETEEKYKINFVDLKTAQNIALYLNGEGNEIYENFYHNFQDNELNLENFIVKINETFNNNEYYGNPQIILNTFGNSKDEATKDFTSLILNNLSDSVYEKSDFCIQDNSIKNNFLYQVRKINGSLETKTTIKENFDSLVALKRNLKQFQKKITENKEKPKNVTKDESKVL